MSPTRLETYGSIVGLSSSKVKPPGQQPDGFNPKTLRRRARAWIKYGTGASPFIERHTEPTTVARKRVVSPELLTSESVAALPIAARYAFVGLWMYLDDEGRGKDNAALIRAHQWPLDDTYTTRKVEADLLRFAQGRLICRYVADGASLLHCPSWPQWQKPNHPTPSRIVPCPLELAGVDHESFPWDSRSPTGVLPEGYGSANGSLPRNVVEVSSDEGSSSDGGDGLAEFRRARDRIGHSA